MPEPKRVEDECPHTKKSCVEYCTREPGGCMYGVAYPMIDWKTAEDEELLAWLISRGQRCYELESLGVLRQAVRHLQKKEQG